MGGGAPARETDKSPLPLVLVVQRGSGRRVLKLWGPILQSGPGSWVLPLWGRVRFKFKSSPDFLIAHQSQSLCLELFKNISFIPHHLPLCIHRYVSCFRRLRDKNTRDT